MATALSLSPVEAWQPLPSSDWNEAAARHLLNRLGWTATAAETARALQDGPAATLRRCFGKMPEFPKPPLIAKLEEDFPSYRRKLGAGGGSEREKREARREARERSREAMAEMTIEWLTLAARPENAAAEKWLLFLQDVWVVSLEKVKNAALLYQHQDWLRRGALASYRDVAKAMSRSPAMVLYLDLQQSKADAPNENFARELFELFTLGEGHYTEADIKQAARAFTGYRQVDGKFALQRRQHDAGSKTVFGQTGRFDGDGVIDLVFQQPAAATFLPREMVKFYLSDVPLPEDYLTPLGDWWAKKNFQLGSLLGAFFCSRLFYAPEFRGNFIKSPLQFYLGLMQDLDVTPAPLPRRVIGALRQMGQMPFNPPNVRGWVGGKNWINSATLATRRAVVSGLLSPLPEDLLNGDERAALRAAGGDMRRYTLAPERLEAWATLPAEAAASALLEFALPARAKDQALREQLARFLADAEGTNRERNALRAALGTLLESPDYQLC
ncbi:MAG: DUF1800 domain-containing protein [Opitutus sp.]|nr:DUF1800 domain-containing protein [Opitutus sp.]